ncbi:hypothetical protein PG997_014810 [Apiospora hydei]|uniref:Uncharacterized protein n=1 Tax=Apiospora hydei TaxID=1337664 RepID=A0ABR1UUX6_9PEZI
MRPKDSTHDRPPVYTPDEEQRYPGDCLPGGSSLPFTRFLDFPADIQLLIWKHAAAAPAILRLDKNGAVYFESGLLTACTASRAAFLQFPGTVRSLYGWGAAKKAGPSDFDCDYPQCPRSGKPGVWWRPQLDLVVLGRGMQRNDLGRIAGADQIRHLAIHYDDAISYRYRPYFVSFSTNEQWDHWLTTIFPDLRTWEIYAE